MSDEFVNALAGEGANEAGRLFHLHVAIENILTSYDDPYDAFSELIQNSIDALREEYEKRVGAGDHDYVPQVTIDINLTDQTICVTDNGCGVSPDDKLEVIRPNRSLKRRLRHSNARGEKGAAMVFLQFGHKDLKFESKTADGRWTYELHGGIDWFREVTKLIDESEDEEQLIAGLPASPHEWSEAISPTLDAFESGSRVTVTFPDTRLTRLFGNADNAPDRLEYLLRTRTAIGYVAPNGRLEDAEILANALAASGRIQLPGGEVLKKDIEVGFLYPHQLALKKTNRRVSRLTNPAADSELLYDFFDRDWIQNYLDEVWNNGGFAAKIDEFELSGYVSYAYQNQWYEELTAHYLELPDDDQAVDPEREIVRDEMLQVNSGFVVAVRNYPNGRRQAFMHRTGAEHKSRTFVVLNFGGGYKPDYGRKNLADEVRPLVIDLCKKMIAFATTPVRKSNLKVGTAAAPHGVENVDAARAALLQEGEQFRADGVWVQTGDGRYFTRPANTENEVISEFIHLVRLGALPGFRIFGAPASGQLDATFDYDLPMDDRWGYNAATNPLGVNFPEGNPRSAVEKWIEYKVTSDMLIDDLNKAAGAGGKKYFTTIDVLVCERVDDATDNYEIEEVDEGNVNARTYFGVTHLLRSPQNVEHVVQVVELRTLREKLGAE